MFRSRRSSSSAAAGRAGSPPAGNQQRPLFLHLGLAKTGTTFLQGSLAQQRPLLREAGTIYPFIWPEGMFHAAVDVVGQHEEWAIPEERRHRAWEALVTQAETFDGAALISHEILALASPDQARHARDRLSGYEVNLVVTVRDLARQLPAYWQEEVKNGSTLSFAELATSVLATVSGAPDAAGERFWHGQDVLAVIDRWSEDIAPERIHLVTCPPSGAAPEVLWERFAGAAGFPGLRISGDLDQANQSLGCAQVQLLRTINRELGPSLTREQHIRIVKRRFAQKVLSSTRPSRAPRTPEDLRDPLTAVADRWKQEIRARGYVVHGDLDDLRPASFASDGRHPDDVTDTEAAAIAPAATIGLLEALAEMQGQA